MNHLPPPGNDSTDVVLELRSVTRRIEVFFDHQMQKLRTAMQQLEEMQAEFNVARRMSAGLETRSEEFRQEREKEMERLTSASEALAHSWSELEQKQRDVAIQANAERQSQNMTNQQESWQTGNPSTGNGFPSNGNSPVEMDLFQMQQLQAQIDRHKKRSR